MVPIRRTLLPTPRQSFPLYAQQVADLCVSTELGSLAKFLQRRIVSAPCLRALTHCRQSSSGCGPQVFSLSEIGKQLSASEPSSKLAYLRAAPPNPESIEILVFAGSGIRCAAFAGFCSDVLREVTAVKTTGSCDPSTVGLLLSQAAE